MTVTSRDLDGGDYKLKCSGGEAVFRRVEAHKDFVVGFVVLGSSFWACIFIFVALVKAIAPVAAWAHN